MAVPPRPGSEAGSAFEHDPRTDPAPRVPRSMPESNQRAGTTALVIAALAVIIVALIVLL